MFSYFKADCLRISKEKTGWVSIAILTLVIGVLSYFIKDIQAERQGVLLEILKILTMFMALSFLSPLSYFFGQDFDMRTINHLLSKGRSRTSILLYKITASSLMASLFLVYFFGIFGLFNLLFAGNQEFGILYPILLRQLPFFLAFHLFGILAFVTFKNTNISLVSFIIYLFAGENMLFSILSNILKNSELTKYSLGTGLVNSMVETNTSILLVAGIYILLFILLSTLIFSRKEMK